MGGYSAKHVANYFLKKYGSTGITPLKIQKLVYIAHGWHLAIHDEPLVDDEYVEAWQHGPVFPSLYYEFRHRGRLPIIRPATKIDENFDFVVPSIERDDRKTPKLLDRIWKVYGGRSGIDLSELCHQPNSSWDIARRKTPGRRNAHIDDEVIKQHYKRKLEYNRARHG